MKIGKVYKIICTQSNDIYIGSTFNTLRDRFRRHKNHYNDYLNNKGHKLSIMDYFSKYTVDNFKIVLIKEYKVIDRKHLEAYEQLWINKLKPINTQSAFRVEYLSKKKYQNNYYENNKDKLQKKNKEYRKNNTQTLLCICGSQYKQLSKHAHLKTKKHLKYLDTHHET